MNYKFKIIKICEFQEVFDDLLKLLKVRYPRCTISKAITVTRIQSLKLKKNILFLQETPTTTTTIITITTTMFVVLSS